MIKIENLLEIIKPEIYKNGDLTENIKPGNYQKKKE